MNLSKSKIFYLQLAVLLVLKTGAASYAQNLNATVTVNNNPSEDYLFIALSFAGVGNLWIVDNNLTPVFYKKVVGAIYDFKYQPNGELTYNVYSTLSYGLDSSGTLFNQYFTPTQFALDIHELTVLEDGSYYILGRDHITVDMSQIVPGGDTSATLVAHTIHHMDANDNELWRWESFNHYDILDVDDNVDLTQRTIDWTHCNSIEIDNDGNIILSTRNFNEVTKINRQSGDIIWRLGGKKNQFQFINDNRGFGRQHDARRHSNGNLILFDNGHFLVPEYSSYVEYELDDINLKATLINRYSKDESIFTKSRGSVQELRNGNTLIGWGENINPYVTEINDKDSIEFELVLHSAVHKYRTYRFPWQTNYFFTNTSSLDFGTVSLGDSALQDIWLKNRKDTSITLNEFYLQDSAFSVIDSLPIVIPRNDSVKVTIMFKPLIDGFYLDKLNIRYTTINFLVGRQVQLIGQTTLSSVKNDSKQFNDYYLSQNFPNPFNPSTNITFSIPKDERVSIKIYNPIGEKIEEIVNKEFTAGKHTLIYNASNLPSGIYYYRITAGSFTQTRKLLLLK
ncbi:MAG: T9SS type A sorting domain-containing protein [Ignavibacteriaceae bacterium]|nr:aryl-sulfate sulfotransferase [Ignavibacteria bacterium]MBT8392885.1 aryl-sulfate sulfotransferase [Ignavibacteria bacterium]NNJ51665.1 T9SS type A sorting domain-containing protein [Ignavibacteriaceae bacterium]NNL22679.1 T9SS type A sorting domain-containing protein [Ignavibacteriaceae bacterium]